MSEVSDRYWASFIVCGVLCVAFQLFSAERSAAVAATSTSERFSKLQYNYLVVFLLAMFSDWLQGPYVYELYVSYGFSQSQIAELFVCGFGSSMAVGTVVGSLADKWGRKLMCQAYCVCYIIACITKLFPDYWILMLGRFLSGVATSLLFSVFESWMVCEHYKQGFDSSLLGSTFSLATFGNGIIAVVAGLIANYVASSFGYVAPFVVAIFSLTAVFALVSFKWSENYGNQTSNAIASLTKGFELVRNDSRIAALGLAQSFFEGAMYTFVFMWTPALKTDIEQRAEETGVELEDSTSMHLGLIFSVFMVCVMLGSSIFKLASKKAAWKYKIPLVMHGVAFASMVTTTLCIQDKSIVYAMFLLFEMTVGVFYPAYGVIKSEKIPEEIRSSVMNIFRMPLNGFVVLLLLKIKYLSTEKVFMICAVAHALSFLCYYHFYSSLKNTGVDNALSTFDDDSDIEMKKDRL